jgi:hypothetical protein
MKLRAVFCPAVATLVLLATTTGCEEEEHTVIVEKVEGYKPNLPPIPSIPKPTAPETYGDGAYSVFGLRRNISNTIEQQVAVTGYIAEIYQKPECPEGKTCHTVMPHLYLADDKGETLKRRQLRLVGYARSFKEMEDEKEAAETGRENELAEGVYVQPVVWDWQLGQKYTIMGRFTRQSGEGFMETDGLLEYSSHQCLDCPLPEEVEGAEEKNKEAPAE